MTLVTRWKSLGEDTKIGVPGGQRTRKGHSVTRTDCSCLGPYVPPQRGVGAWPEIRGPPASARALPASRGAFSAQNNAGSLKGWAAGDGCFSKHRTSFAKQALIPRPGGPRCLLGGRRGWGLCLAGRGALETQEQSLGQSWMGLWLTWAVSAEMLVGAGVCISFATSSPACPTHWSPLQRVLALSCIQHVLLEFQDGVAVHGLQKNEVGKIRAKDLEFMRQGRNVPEPRVSGLDSRT